MSRFLGPAREECVEDFFLANSGIRLRFGANELIADFGGGDILLSEL